MLYVNICVCVVLMLVWSYLFIKTYQLDGYNIKIFINNIFELRLAYGDKNKLVFTKRMIRFLFIYSLLIIGIFFLLNYFIENIYLLILDCAIAFLLTPIFIILTHYILLPFEILIKKCYV